MKNVPKNLRFEVSPEEFREHLKRVERIEKELIRFGYLYDCDGKPLTHIEKEAIRMLRAGVPFPEAECGTWRALSPGEDALIKALIAVKLEHVYNEGDSLLVYSLENCPTFHVSHIAFHVPEGIEKRKAIFDALKKIKDEKEGKQ